MNKTKLNVSIFTAILTMCVVKLMTYSALSILILSVVLGVVVGLEVYFSLYDKIVDKIKKVL